jgi:hypothetical protein
MNALVELKQGEKIMVDSTNEKKAPRSMQISMSPDTQDYLKLLALLMGNTAAGIVNTLIDPYIDFTIKVLKHEGLADEFGVLLVSPDVAMKVIKNSRRDPSIQKLIKEETEKTGLEFPFYQPRRL